MNTAASTARAGLAARSDVILAAFAAFALGAFLVYGTGMAAPDALHNAAHDTRHALAFPCH